jgi:biopolymer transport protein TolQ
MSINYLLLNSNPFFDAYIHSDFLGRLIFLGLILLSVCTWVVLIHKLWITRNIRRNSLKFQQLFQAQRLNPLQIDYHPQEERHSNPFHDLYQVLKKQTVEILNKNRRFVHLNRAASSETASYLSPSDVEFVESHLYATVSAQTQNLEKNLYILATIVSLAPFLGLLGTVWGILTTFGELQSISSGSTHQMVLGGLSLALATTVMGLLDAIPALVGYNYLKNAIKDYQTEMECFSNEILTSVELQYRKVDLS